MARKILLADDSVTAQNMGRKILTDAGYEVLTVNNGSAALKKVAEHKPDLIVLDVYMPGYSGLEVCQRLKENRETARIPILLTVGKLEPFKPEEARRVKADAYVVKPFEASELLTALTRLEDKIVPQASDNQKPGRFAKAIAAFEGGEKFGDAESGWKDRLRFPTGEKKHDHEPEPEIPAPSSHAFRDLAREETQGASTTQPEFERPLPAGLPADITAEEIAAITAAAAQLSGKTVSKDELQPAVPPAAEEKPTAEPVAAAAASVEASSAPPPSEAVSESKSSDVGETSVASPASETVTQQDSSPVTLASAASSAEVVESPVVQESAVPEVVASAPDDTAVVAATTLPAGPAAEAKATEESQANEPPKLEERPVEAAASAAGDADVIAALETLKPSNGNALPSESAVPGPTDGVASPSLVAAVAAMKIAGVARWIAEPIAVEHIEASVSLEGEMQKAFAAFAAADGARMSLPAQAAISGSYVVPFSAESTSVAIAEPPVVATVPSEPSTILAEPAAIPTPSPAEAEAVQPSPASSSEKTSAPPASAVEDHSDRKDSHAEALRAAAWANWHQIRDSIVGSTSAPIDKDVPDQKEAAAAVTEDPGKDSDTMAAAASAGTSSSTAAEAGAIANIVDSVLAELRPKIVEEITRKLGNEKKNKK